MLSLPRKVKGINGSKHRLKFQMNREQSEAVTRTLRKMGGGVVTEETG